MIFEAADVFLYFLSEKAWNVNELWAAASAAPA